MDLTEASALETYARMLNNLDPALIKPILAEDFVYESQSVLAPLRSKQEFMEYIVPKVKTIKSAKANIYAEMGQVNAFGRMHPCLIIAQGTKDTLVATVLAEVENEKLKRLDLCIVPPPQLAIRSGEYPS